MILPLWKFCPSHANMQLFQLGSSWSFQLSQEEYPLPPPLPENSLRNKELDFNVKEREGKEEKA